MKMLIPLFSALLAAGAFIRIPLPPIPITLQTLFVFLMGYLLTAKEAALSMLLYLFLGLAGLPIFTSGGGIAAAAGPTAGYLWGMLPAVIIGALLSRRKHDSVLFNIAIAIVMELCIYIPGLIWLGISRDLSPLQTISGGLIPFIPGDAIKIAAAAISAKALYPELQRLREKQVS